MLRPLLTSFLIFLSLSLSSSVDSLQAYDIKAEEALLRLKQCGQQNSCRLNFLLSKKRDCIEQAVISETKPQLRRLAEEALAAEMKRRNPSTARLRDYNSIMNTSDIVLNQGTKRTGPKPSCEDGRWRGQSLTIV